jgi:FMNH2-dependent dimethyl sulfone monooxygenase
MTTTSDPAANEGLNRAECNAVFNENKLKLGLFGINCDSGCAMTTVDERHRLTWASTKQVARAADRAGYEILVPVARWKGLGGETNFNGRNFETYAWAAGLASVTEHITLTTTSHVQTTHPLFAAKQAATIDHISGGRYCLNMVTGWFHPELEMFGASFLAHDDRYDYAQEWYDIVKAAWTDPEEFDFAGTYHRVQGAFSQPKPLQRPYPAVINAGGSAKGVDFIARNADIGYVVLSDHNDMEKARNLVDDYRRQARGYGREVQVWTHAYVIQRDTQAEADAYLDRIAVEFGNDTAGDATAHFLGVNSQIMNEDSWNSFKIHLKAGYGGLGLVGTTDTIAAKLRALSDAGIDGVALHWVDYLDGMGRFNSSVLPLLEQEGLRKPYEHPSRDAQ